MPGKINLYNLGDLGVDLVASPLHAGTGSWQRLQNAEFSNIQGQGGVKKRGALLRLNSEALNGGASILVLANMPLETDALLATESVWLFAPGSNLAVAVWPTFPTSDSFDVFSPLTGLANAPCGDDTGRVNARLAATIGTTMYFISTGSDPGSPTGPVLYSWDGSTLTTIVAEGDWPQDSGNDVVNIADVFSDGTDLYVIAQYLTNQIQVLQLAAGTGTPTPFADLIGGLKVGTNVALGRITSGTASGLTDDSFILCFTANSDSRYRIWIKAPLDTTWSASGGDNGTTARAGMCGPVTFNDIPYVGTFGNFGLAAQILRRTSSTNWGTAAFDGPSDGTGVGFGHGIVFDSKIFFQFEDPGTGASRIYVSSTGAPASWTLDKDFAADFSVDPATQRLQAPIVFDGDLYWLVKGTTGNEATGKLLKRDTAGTWTAVIEDAAIYIASALYGA